MNLKELLISQKIEKVEKSDFNLEKSDLDLKVADNNFENKNYEWALSIGYSAILRAGLNLMSFLGYRAKGKEHHKNVFLFLKTFKKFEGLANYFDRIRRKRNEFVYRGFDEISKSESHEVLGKAKEFVSEIRTFVSEIRTGEKNEN